MNANGTDLESGDLSPENTALQKISRRSSRGTKVSMVFLALVIAFSLASSGFALYARFGDTNERRTIQQQFNQRVRDVSLNYCQEIELLKRGFREDATENRRNLARNLRILGVEATPEVVRIADAQEQHKLKLYAADPCPRPANVIKEQP